MFDLVWVKFLLTQALVIAVTLRAWWKGRLCDSRTQQKYCYMRERPAVGWLGGWRRGCVRGLLCWICTSSIEGTLQSLTFKFTSFLCLLQRVTFAHLHPYIVPRQRRHDDGPPSHMLRWIPSFFIGAVSTRRKSIEGMTGILMMFLQNAEIAQYSSQWSCLRLFRCFITWGTDGDACLCCCDHRNHIQLLICFLIPKVCDWQGKSSVFGKKS